MIEPPKRKVNLIGTDVNFFTSFLTLLSYFQDSFHSDVMSVHSRSPSKLMDVTIWEILKKKIIGGRRDK